MGNSFKIQVYVTFARPSLLMLTAGAQSVARMKILANKSRTVACAVLAIIPCVDSFVSPSTPGAGNIHRTRSRGIAGSGVTEVNALAPWGAESIAETIASSAGGISNVWLAASGEVPTNAYVTTGLFGVVASAIVVGAGGLLASVVLGEEGIGAFLSKEKRNNPFYKDTVSKMKPMNLDILDKIRLPDLNFVEVYNQPPREVEDDGISFDADLMIEGGENSSVVATAESLRQRLLEAVQAKEYVLASTLERELASFMKENGMSFEDDRTK